MGCATDILLIAQGINHDFSIIDATETESNNTSTYDAVTTNKALRRKTEKLFKDGHHARAVEEAYKLLDNTVKVKAGLQQTDLTGAKLMQTAFSPNKPLLRLNECVSTSEQNEQSGYMQILAGCMVGIRNPRAHDSDWEDTEERSLQLLSFANHLMERILVSEKVDY